MNVYKPNGSKNYRFAIISCNGPDLGGRRQRVISTGTPNRRIAEEIRRKTELLAGHVEAGLPLTQELREWLENVSPNIRKRLDQLGLIPKDVSLQLTAISEYIEEYLSDCAFRGDGCDFIKVKRRQLKLIFAEADIQTLSQLKHDRIKPFMEQLKGKGRSNRTLNMYRATVNAFANWLVEDGPIEKHDLHRLSRLNEKQDKRHPRRPATDEQMRQLLDSVPEHRRFVYLAAAMTGLRRGELGQVEKRDFNLTDEQLRVRPEVSKNREEAVLPLHPDMLAVLKDKLAGLKPTDRVFHPVPNILTYQRDLERVGIEYKDENGRYLDFHSLRGTFATRLLRHGVHPSKAIRLTRHKSVKTLETYYDMLGLTDAEDAMGQLPGLGSRIDGDDDDEPTDGLEKQEYPRE